MNEKLINVGLLRLHNVYENPCEISSEKSQLYQPYVEKFYKIKNLLFRRSGEQRRSLVYVDDLVERIISLFKKRHEQRYY